MRTLRTLLAIAVVAAISACGSGGLLDEAVPPGLQGVLENPDKVTLYTLVTEQDLPDAGISRAEFDKMPSLLRVHLRRPS
jgi:hypothetical protein